MIPLMEQLDTVLRDFLNIKSIHTNCRVCNRKLTDPVSIYRGVGPECANTEYDLRIPDISILTELEHEACWGDDGENPTYPEVCVRLWFEAMCPWCDLPLTSLMFTIDCSSWNSENCKIHGYQEWGELEELKDAIDEVINNFAGYLRYEWQRNQYENSWMCHLEHLIDNINSYEPWVEIAKTYLIMEPNDFIEELYEVMPRGQLFDNVQINLNNWDDPQCSCEEKPVDLFCYDWSDDDGQYDEKQVKKALGPKRRKALFWSWTH